MIDIDNEGSPGPVNDRFRLSQRNLPIAKGFPGGRVWQTMWTFPRFENHNGELRKGSSSGHPGICQWIWSRTRCSRHFPNDLCDGVPFQQCKCVCLPKAMRGLEMKKKRCPTSSTLLFFIRTRVTRVAGVGVGSRWLFCFP